MVMLGIEYIIYQLSISIMRRVKECYGKVYYEIQKDLLKIFSVTDPDWSFLWYWWLALVPGPGTSSHNIYFHWQGYRFGCMVICLRNDWNRWPEAVPQSIELDCFTALFRYSLICATPIHSNLLILLCSILLLTTLLYSTSLNSTLVYSTLP